MTECSHYPLPVDFDPTRRASIRELANDASTVVRLAQELGSFVITNRGVPAAIMVPLSDATVAFGQEMSILAALAGDQLPDQQAIVDAADAAGLLMPGDTECVAEAEQDIEDGFTTSLEEALLDDLTDPDA